ncbi:hypothetical protein [Saccharopolyspora gregorii]|uniref:Uncharacterized protein n=1 Tax=Saccharopolyspora gregorii TaxID=33914 RepID=A0ABP6S3B8_9PSEU
MAADLLNQVTRNDPIVRFPVPEITSPISHMLGADRIEGDPRLFSRPRTTSISYSRRAATCPSRWAPRSSRCSTAAAPSPAASTSRPPGSSPQGGRRAHHGWNVNHGGYVGAVFTGPLGQGVKTGTHDVDGLGVGVINLQPFSHSRGAENSRSLESGQTLTVETAPEKVYLARVKVHAGMVAEATYKGNLDQLELFSRPDPRAAGSTWNCRSRSWCG